MSARDRLAALLKPPALPEAAPAPRRVLALSQDDPRRPRIERLLKAKRERRKRLAHERFVNLYYNPEEREARQATQERSGTKQEGIEATTGCNGDADAREDAGEELKHRDPAQNFPHGRVVAQADQDGITKVQHAPVATLSPPGLKRSGSGNGWRRDYGEL